ncbi:MAG TPA: VOC family protein [Candidatus Angelobacter sp.]
MKSKVDYKPEGFHSVTPYLTVKGAAKLLDFLKEAFGAEELGRHPRPDGGIAHACTKIGDSFVEVSDGTEQWPAMPAALHVYVPDVEAVYQRALKAGGTSLQTPTDQFYGERSGAVRDVCGNNWYIATQIEILTREEIEKRAAVMAGKRS